MKTNLLKQIVLVSGILLFLSNTSLAKSAGTVPAPKTDNPTLSKEQLQRFCGEYLPQDNDPKMTKMSVILFKDILYRHVNTDYVALNPVSANKFIYDDNSGRSLEFVSDKNNNVKEVLVVRPDGKFTLRKNLSPSRQPTVAVPQGVSERIAQLVETSFGCGQFNGSIFVAHNGVEIYKKAFGMANIELGVPNQVETKYRLASVSKQFTAMLIMQLVAQGKLDLHVPITTYLPDYPKKQGQKITLHHLLNHSSGIPNFTSFDDYKSKVMRNSYTPEQLVKLFDTLPLLFEPGKRFDYSNSAYVLLGYIIEKVNGKTYEQCLKDGIFNPLRMNNSGQDHNGIILTNRAAGYDKVGSAFENASFIDMSVPFSAGALYSTVEDLYLWDQALQGETLLAEKWKALMFQNYFADGPGGYGYGWGITKMTSLRKKQEILYTEHSGGINGFNTFISRAPEQKQVTVLLCNISAARLGSIANAIKAILYDLPYDLPKKSLAFALVDAIKTKEPNESLSKYSEMKNSGAYQVDEGEMNMMGYVFLQDNKVDEAIELFKINVEAFPNSGNCYDSLGEAYLKKGEKNLAILNYKKSLELDPKNDNAKKVLLEISK